MGARWSSRGRTHRDWLRHGGSYVDTRVVEATWSRGWQVRYWLAPLEQTCDELRRAGFLLERLVEPRPVPEAADLRPEAYARLHRDPAGFPAVRALARPQHEAAVSSSSGGAPARSQGGQQP